MSLVLAIAYMKKLKIILPFSLFVICYVIFTVNHKPISKYNKNETEITGRIYSCQIKEDQTIIKIKGKENILINYYGKINCILGYQIKAKGEMKMPNQNTNFNLFNYQNYLKSEKINYTFKAQTIKIIDKKTPLIYKIKNTLYKRANSFKSHKYLKAFILGNDAELEENTKNSYQINGISHLLAISGAQITMLSCFLLYILKKILSKTNAYIVTIFVLIFYLFLTDFQASILRATIFFIILTVNKELNQKIDTITLLALTCGILLIYNPFYIYNLGFLLSFTVSFFLIAMSKTISKEQNYFLKTFKISLIAFLASAPILINNFHQLNLLTPLINLYFVPFVSFIIYPLSLITFVFKPLDKILLFIIKIMENASINLSQIEIFNLTLAHINIIFFILYYIIITIILYKYSKGKNYIFIFFIILFIHHNINYLNPISKITMLDVGQGDSILIKLKHNKGNILIDTGGIPNYGNKKTFEIAKNITIPYLKSEGINHLDYLILTHGDIDHAKEALNIIKNFKVNNLILNKENNELEKNIIKNFDKKVLNISEGSVKINDIKLFFLNGLNTHNENKDSLIIYTQIENKNILLMGDATKESEKYLQNTYNLPKMDILKVGHHGSNTSTSKEFVQSISPKISLISAGKNNIYGHPHQITLQNLKNSNVFITKKDGAIEINLKNLAIKTAR